jgi:hypothetical protein
MDISSFLSYLLRKESGSGIGSSLVMVFDLVLRDSWITLPKGSNHRFYSILKRPAVSNLRSVKNNDPPGRNVEIGPKKIVARYQEWPVSRLSKSLAMPKN